jgi:TetR/AcrR family transcriptional regulator
MDLIDKFESLQADKRNNIINEALREFAEKGYEAASTNNIIKNAKISKGLLFHYFGSKKKLYLYLIEHSIDVSDEKVMKNVKGISSDLFDMIVDFGGAKMKVAIEEPLIYNFLMRIYLEDRILLEKILEDKVGMTVEEQMESWFGCMDKTKFKDDIDAKKILKLVYIISEGTIDRYTDYLKSANPDKMLEKIKNIQDEIVYYFELLKKGIYK